MWEKLSNGIQSVSVPLSVGNRLIVVNEVIIGNRMARWVILFNLGADTKRSLG